LNYALAEDL